MASPGHAPDIIGVAPPRWAARMAASEESGIFQMAHDPVRDWMWSEACDMLARAERMQRTFFRPAPSVSSPAWEPPVDILETRGEVIILVALPGVDADRADVVIDGGELVIGGTRELPPELQTAVIHRLELPQGRFHRRVPLPPGRYDQVRRMAGNGYLVITLKKAEQSRG